MNMPKQSAKTTSMRTRFTQIEHLFFCAKHHLQATMNNNFRLGFTLIEVLVVTFILVILATTSFRVSKYAMYRSKMAKCSAELSRYATAAEDMRMMSGHFASSVFDSSQAAGLPVSDPWGSRYGYIAIEQVTGYNQLMWRSDGPMEPYSIGGGWDRALRSSNTVFYAAYQEFVVFSMGEDLAPGVARFDDDKDQGLPDPYTPGGASGTVDFHSWWGKYVPDPGEIGYGDDVVVGNCSRRKGF